MPKNSAWSTPNSPNSKFVATVKKHSQEQREQSMDSLDTAERKQLDALLDKLGDRLPSKGPGHEQAMSWYKRARQTGRRIITKAVRNKTAVPVRFPCLAKAEACGGLNASKNVKHHPFCTTRKRWHRGAKEGSEYFKRNAQVLVTEILRGRVAAAALDTAAAATAAQSAAAASPVLPPSALSNVEMTVEDAAAAAAADSTSRETRKCS